jgi:hypothetical protein
MLNDTTKIDAPVQSTTHQTVQSGLCSSLISMTLSAYIYMR